MTGPLGPVRPVPKPVRLQLLEFRGLVAARLQLCELRLQLCHTPRAVGPPRVRVALAAENSLGFEWGGEGSPYLSAPFLKGESHAKGAHGSSVIIVTYNSHITLGLAGDAGDAQKRCPVALGRFVRRGNPVRHRHSWQEPLSTWSIERLLTNPFLRRCGPWSKLPRLWMLVLLFAVSACMCVCVC